jgi:hypothetical protein
MLCYFLKSLRLVEGDINSPSYMLLIPLSVCVSHNYPSARRIQPGTVTLRRTAKRLALSVTWPHRRGPQLVMTDALFNDAYAVSIFMFQCGSC